MGFREVFRRKPAVQPRYPFLRRFLLERCTNREQAERLLSRRDLHDAERALIRWGRETLIALRERFPDLTDEQQERAETQRTELESSELADGLPTAFSLWSPLVEWSLDMKRREVRCTFEAYAVDPSSSKFDFARKRLETATLRL